MVMSWVQYVEPIGNDFLDNVKENMMRDINTWVSMDKQYFESAKEKANELLRNLSVVFSPYQMYIRGICSIPGKYVPYLSFP